MEDRNDAVDEAEREREELLQREAHVARLKEEYAELTERKKELERQVQRLSGCKGFMERVVKITKVLHFYYMHRRNTTLNMFTNLAFFLPLRLWRRLFFVHGFNNAKSVKLTLKYNTITIAKYNLELNYKLHLQHGIN